MDINLQVKRLMSLEVIKTVKEAELKWITSLVDLTSLSSIETEEDIEKLCLVSKTSLGRVAAICVYPKFIELVRKYLPSKDIHIASVANFPTGNETWESIRKQIRDALARGAEEIDLVFPYDCYKSGERQKALDILLQSKAECGAALLKVILETSEFESSEEIYTLSQQVIEQGADFIKTSTGKTQQGATLEAANAMLLAIKNSEKEVGFKASGGINQPEEAMGYVNLAVRIMGENWVNPRHFRIGASSLVQHMLANVSN